MGKSIKDKSKGNNILASCCIVKQDEDNILSGFLFSKSGYILTAGHGFFDNEEYGEIYNNKSASLSVQFNVLDAVDIKAKLLLAVYNSEEYYDFAVLKVDAKDCKNIEPLPVCCRNFIGERHEVYGYEHNTKAAFSSVPVKINNTLEKCGVQGYFDYNHSALGPGSSGSPILDTDIGAVVGIHVEAVDTKKAKTNLDGRFGMPLFKVIDHSPIVKEILLNQSYYLEWDEKRHDYVGHSHLFFRQSERITRYNNSLVISIKHYCSRHMDNYDDECNLIKDDIIYDFLNISIEEKFGNIFRIIRAGEMIHLILTKLSGNPTALLEEIVMYFMALSIPVEEHCKPCGGQYELNLMIGMGSGCCLYDGRNYYGQAIEVSRSLMDWSWPKGISILGNISGVDIRNITGKYNDEDNEIFIQKDILVKALTRAQKVPCYVTSTAVNWKCIAWPGFQKLNLNNGDTLNSIGLTFLTHQGLSGNLDNVQIWPGRYKLDNGESFDLMIDDYDSIAMKIDQKEIDVFKRQPLEAESTLVLQLRDMPWKDKNKKDGECSSKCVNGLNDS